MVAGPVAAGVIDGGPRAAGWALAAAGAPMAGTLMTAATAGVRVSVDMSCPPPFAVRLGDTAESLVSPPRVRNRHNLAYDTLRRAAARVFIQGQSHRLVHVLDGLRDAAETSASTRCALTLRMLAASSSARRAGAD
jgi:hypothetical protein